MDFRDKRGRYASKKGRKKGKSKIPTVLIDHNYVVGKVCDGVDCRNPQCTSYEHRGVGNREGWKVGRRLIELEVLLSNLKYCQACRLGPVPLTYHNIVGEMQKGLSGYLYVECQILTVDTSIVLHTEKPTINEMRRGCRVLMSTLS